MGIWYATRGAVKASLEANESAASNRLIDQRLDASSRAVEGILKRRFYPERKTLSFDWPNFQYAYPWRLWLDGNELISLETLVAGGATIVGADRFLRRADDMEEPPYDSIEIDQDSNAVFMPGNTFQKSIAVTGLFGWNDTDVSLSHAVLSGAINASVTSVVLNPTSGTYNVDVGSIILIGTERLVLVERAMSAVSGQTLQSTISDIQNIHTVGVNSGAVFAIGETILLDAERMRIDDIAGNNLIVTRAFDGTTLGSHTAGATVYALRTFTARRGALGSTAASHSNADPVYAHDFSTLVPLVHELTVAIAVMLLEQNAAGYTTEMGSGASSRETPGVGLLGLIDQAREAYGRVSRSDAI